MSMDGAEQQQYEAAARRPWTKERSRHAACCHCSAKRLAFKPLRHQIRDGHRDPPHQPVSVCFSERAEGAPELQSREYVAGCWRIKRWWQRIERTRENAADPSHAFQKRDVACTIAR